MWFIVEVEGVVCCWVVLFFFVLDVLMKYVYFIVFCILVVGSVFGELLYVLIGLSFWGGVDLCSVEVIDCYYLFSGCYLYGRLLVIFGGCGFCIGSSVLLELIFGGCVLVVIFLCELDEIFVFGVIVVEELFGCLLFIVCFGECFDEFVVYFWVCLVDGCLEFYCDVLLLLEV